MGGWVGGYLTLHIAYLPTYPATNLPKYLPSNLPTCVPTYQHSYLHTYIPTYQYIHNFITIVLIVTHPTFSGSHWSSFRYELKSFPVRFSANWCPFWSVSVPIEVRFGIFVGPFRSVPIRFGKSYTEQIWHKFINILLCSIIKWPFNWQCDLIELHASFIFSYFHLWDSPINYDCLSSAKSSYKCESVNTLSMHGIKLPMHKEFT